MPQLDVFVWFDGALSVAVLFALFQFGFAFLLLPFVVRNWVITTFIVWWLSVGKVVISYRLLNGQRVSRFFTANKLS